MRVLGIDPGLIRTGWAVVEPAGSRSVVVGHGVIAPPTHADLPARLGDGADRLRAVLAEFCPTLVVLEEVFTAPRHPRSALLMAHMRGAICLVLHEAGVPIVSLTATTVKQRLTSSGHASKEQVQRMVLRLTGLDASSSLRLDETDAIALALAGLHQAVGGPWTMVAHGRPAGEARAAPFVRAIARARQIVATPRAERPPERTDGRPPAGESHV